MSKWNLWYFQICDICHKQIHGKKPISIRCKRIEPLRCAGIRLSQYTYTWTYHQHKGSRLTTHTDIKTTTPFQTLVQAPYPLPTHSSHTSATQTQTHVQYGSHRIDKAQTESSYPLTPFTARAKHILYPPTPFIPPTTLTPITSAVRDTNSDPAALTPTHLLHLQHQHWSDPRTHTLSQHTQTVHATQSPKPPHPHKVPRFTLVSPNY